MTSDKKAATIIHITVALLIVVAVLCRMAGKLGLPMWYELSIVRSVIYITLFSAWGISVRYRVIHTQTRRYLSAISALMVFWIIIRTIKYSFELPPDLTRMLWYLYYLPMLFIPLLAMLIALSLGKPDGFRTPKWSALFYIPTAALLLLVLTNDLHQLVFAFPVGEAAWSDSDYTYAVAYWPVIGWELGCALCALISMVYKCRVPRSRKTLWLPMLPMFGVLIYTALYVIHVPLLFLIAGDITVVECLFIALTFEFCIRCGLIGSNTHYSGLFGMMEQPAVITDENYQPCYLSAPRLELSREQMLQIREGALEQNSGLLLRSMPLRGGHIIWAEDVSELQKLRGELLRTADELSEEKDLLEAEITLKERNAVADTRNRLYDSVTREIAPQFTEIERLTAIAGADTETRRVALRRMCVIGAYIKRRCNLLILNEEKTVISSAELAYCLGESAEQIRQYGASCTLCTCRDCMIPTVDITLAYDLFEQIVEAALPTLTALFIRMDVTDDGLALKLQVECSDEVSVLPELLKRIEQRGGNITNEFENCVQYISLILPEGGESK